MNETQLAALGRANDMTESLKAMVSSYGLPETLRQLAKIVYERKNAIDDRDYRAECDRRVQMLCDMAVKISGE